jgi:hypothetical protein
MRTHNSQTGFALLIFIVVLLGIAGVVGTNLIQSKTKNVYIKKIDHDQAVLARAKQALLSYAVHYHNSTQPYKLFDMGRLPCPDYTFAGITEEGMQDGACGTRQANDSGLLPWKTLEIEALRDSSGECLWYVVSGDYKMSPRADMLNEDSNGLINVVDENAQSYHGNAAGDRPIALIIAPGPALDGQDRTPVDNNMRHCRGGYDEGDYLESDGSVDYSVNHSNTADKIWTYIYGSAAGGLENQDYNDRMVWITRSEYWDAVKAQRDLNATDTNKDINKLTKSMAQCVARYGNDSENGKHWLPWPAEIDMAEYRDDNSYIDQDFSGSPSPRKLMGRFPFDIENTNDNESGSQSTVMKDFISGTGCLTNDQLSLWTNWKDHFFYVVSEGFEMVHGDNDSDFKDRCNSDKCVKVADGTSDEIAAIVFYSDSVTGGQIRDYDPVDADEKDKISNYLETDPNNANISNAHQYPVDATFTGDSQKFYRGLGDLTYCIKVNSSSPPDYFTVTDCSS